MLRTFLRKVSSLIASRRKKSALSPSIIPRQEHGISRNDISPNALKVLYRLHQHGYQAYLVGGVVRDLLLGLHPKDFDVVTNARPEEVRRVFRNCRLIGRRFRLAHIYFGNDIVEVATFRAAAQENSDDHSHSEQGVILRDNVYGSLSDDVWRRDFTINALYYNIADFTVVDYVGGFADLKAKRLRMIGEVKQRYREDPVRILRAIRFACKVNFELTPELAKPLVELKGLIHHVAPSRLFEEVMKMFHSGQAKRVYELLKTHGLFTELFPQTAACLNQAEFPTDALLRCVFDDTDQRVAQRKPVTAAFIIATLLWHPVCVQAQIECEKTAALFPARLQAIDGVLAKQTGQLSIPRRVLQVAREIWLLQMRFHKKHGRFPALFIMDDRFSAAFDFLKMRHQANEPVGQLVEWWQHYLQADPTQRDALVKSENKPPRRKRRRNG